MKSKALSLAPRLLAHFFCYLALLVLYANIFKLRYFNGSSYVSMSMPYQTMGYLALGLISLPVLLLLMWRDTQKASSSRAQRFHRIDYVLLIFVSLYLLSIGSALTIRYESMYNTLANSLILYLCFMVIVKTTLVRLRSKTLLESICWIKFFRTDFPYGPSSTAKKAMASALFGMAGLFLLQVLFVFPYAFDIFHFARTLVIPMAIMQICLLVGLTYCCQTLNEQQQNHEERIKEAATKYAQATEEKIRAERFKIELITNVSHDIRTPLTAILNYIDLIKQLDLSDERLAQYLDIVENRSLRLKTLLSDLVEASKADTGNLETSPQPLNLAELIQQIYGEFEEAFAANQLSFIFGQPEEEAWVCADGKHLWRVMENIFGNAIKYGMPGTRIYADIISTGSQVRFVLKNISREPLNISADMLMEQFVRGDRSRHSEGSGLGLYIARSLIELMKGTFRIEIIGDLFQVVLNLPRVTAPSHEALPRILSKRPALVANRALSYQYSKESPLLREETSGSGMPQNGYLDSAPFACYNESS